MELQETQPSGMQQQQPLSPPQQVIVQQIRQAPTPPPAEVRELIAINPKYGDIVMEMAPREQKFRHFSTILGQFNFLLIPLMCLTAGVVLGIYEQTVPSTAAIGAAGYLAYVFKSNDPKPPKVDPSKET